MLVCSILLQGIALGAFLIVDQLPSRAAFVGVSVGLRLAQGCAAAFTETAAGSMIMRAAVKAGARDMAGTLLGWFEALRGTGGLTGPLVGGFLYEAGGFALPFKVVGSVIVGAAAVAGLLLPSAAADVPAKPAPIGRVLRIPAVLVGSCIFIAIVLIAVSFLDPSLQPHLALPPYNLSSGQVGLIFAGALGGYALASTVSGALATVLGDVPQVVLGIWLMAFGYLLMGPSPLLAGVLPRGSVPLVVAAMVLQGLGGGLAYTPTNNLSLRSCEARGITVDEASDALSAIVNMSFTVGCLLGPLLAGLLVQGVGFAWATTSFGVALFVLVPPFLPFLCNAPKRPQTRTRPAGERAEGLLVNQEPAAAEQSRGPRESC
jgi:MFS family permease